MNHCHCRPDEEEQHLLGAVCDNLLCREWAWRKFPSYEWLSNLVFFFIFWCFLSYLLQENLLWKHKLAFPFHFCCNPLSLGFADLRKIRFLLWHSIWRIELVAARQVLAFGFRTSVGLEMPLRSAESQSQPRSYERSLLCQYRIGHRYQWGLRVNLKQKERSRFLTF